ncbi:MAG: nucleotidyltransferase family protein [Lachnospiraceae bacterium]|nr:nucleotidyltransferase family protein [Lachnospiraceae bacterium]
MGKEQRTDNKKMPAAAWDLLYLAACALHDRAPEEDRVALMDLDRLCRMGVFHNMAAMICMPLERTESFKSADASTVQKWTMEKGKAIRKNMLLDASREQVLTAMEAAGIWYMPLKGSVLQYMYPCYGMRQNGDVDILYDVSCHKKLRRVMENLGFRTEELNKKYHDVFVKPTAGCFEMHGRLFDKASPTLCQYYRGVRDRLIVDEGLEYGRHFSDEDFYIYMIAHMYRHYLNAGAGFRYLADIYVYIWKKGDALDWNYVTSEADKLGMASFEAKMRALSRKIFGENALSNPPALTEKEKTLLADFALSGVYGTSKGLVERKMQEMHIDGGTPGAAVRRRYIVRRLFPDMDWYRRHKPFLAKHKVCIPFFLVYRVFRQLFRYRKSLKTELGALRDIGGK